MNEQYYKEHLSERAGNEQSCREHLSEKAVNEQSCRKYLSERAEQIAEIFRRVRTRRYLIHMIPNTVSAALCADGLASLGARPLMAAAPEEMPEIVSQADGCVINLGQLTKEKQKAARLVLEQGARLGKPLALDPVGCGASQFRMQAAQELLDMPWQGILKGNRSELYSIQQGKLTREGIDSLQEHSLTNRIPPGRIYLATGKTDEILWESGSIQIPRKTASRWNIVGTGCLTGAVTGACCCAAAELAKESSESSHNTEEKSSQTPEDLPERSLSPLKLAAISASLAMAFALEQAGKAEGYGTAKSALLNALGQLSEENFLKWLAHTYLNEKHFQK